MKHLSVGTLESSDCLITLTSSKTLKITIETPLKDAFYDHIHSLIHRIAKNHKITKLHIILQDKGALDFTIEARLKTALERWVNESG